jgi:hypothetical protein
VTVVVVVEASPPGAAVDVDGTVVVGAASVGGVAVDVGTAVADDVV